MVSDNKIADETDRFQAEEEGAVTVDWVVLTATIVFMGVTAAYYVSSSVPHLANSLSSYMGDVTVVPD